MKALGSLGQFDDVQAIIKGKIGEFLMADERIRRLQSSSSLSIQGKAAGLLAEHKAIEGELTQANDAIARIKSGAWTFSDGFTISTAATDLMRHLNSVQALENEAAGVQSPATLDFMYALPWVVLVTAVGLMVWSPWTRRSKQAASASGSLA